MASWLNCIFFKKKYHLQASFSNIMLLFLIFFFSSCRSTQRQSEIKIRIISTEYNEQSDNKNNANKKEYDKIANSKPQPFSLKAEKQVPTNFFRDNNTSFYKKLFLPRPVRYNVNMYPNASYFPNSPK